MRLSQLAIGDRFEFEGQGYVKTGPLTAASEAGGSRMIPRHAVLQPVGTAAAAAARKVPVQVVLSAFDDFYTTCLAQAAPASADALAEARERFLQALR